MVQVNHSSTNEAGSGSLKADSGGWTFEKQDFEIRVPLPTLMLPSCQGSSDPYPVLDEHISIACLQMIGVRQAPRSIQGESLEFTKIWTKIW